MEKTELHLEIHSCNNLFFMPKNLFNNKLSLRTSATSEAILYV